MSEGGVPGEMYLLLGKIDGKLDGIIEAQRAFTTRVEGVEVRVGAVERTAGDAHSRLDALQAERAQQVPEFNTLLDRATHLETWRTQVEATTKTTALAVRIIWGLIGTTVLGLIGWLITAYVHSLPVPAIEHRETLKITETKPVASEPPSTPH